MLMMWYCYLNPPMAYNNVKMQLRSFPTTQIILEKAPYLTNLL